tara:strand:- start:781 stop:1404 length:624 start_codon:yes stop_codon:yes gene_type:complete
LLSNKNKFSFKTNQPIILASGSLIRKKILKNTGLRFNVMSSNVDEELFKKKFKGKTLNFICKKLAELKAIKISQKYNNSYVIGADQICALEKKILAKPKTEERARNQLKMLSGKEHKQICGCSICYNGKLLHSFYNIAVLKMRNLSKKEIQDYIAHDMPLKSCGAYRFESKGYLLFSNVIGDQYTIQGLPIFTLLSYLFKKKIIEYE